MSEREDIDRIARIIAALPNEPWNAASRIHSEIIEPIEKERDAARDALSNAAGDVVAYAERAEEAEAVLAKVEKERDDWLDRAVAASDALVRATAKIAEQYARANLAEDALAEARKLLAEMTARMDERFAREQCRPETKGPP
jgi:hypothetical protein